MSARFWVRMPDGDWKEGTLKEPWTVVEFDDGTSETFKQPIDPVDGSSDVMPSNPLVVDGVEDMIELSRLHEPALLHNIFFRYKYDLIYTYVGHLLVAVNPYKQLPIYTEDMVKLYAANQARAPDGSRLAPHVFSVADNSYRAMVRDQRSQSIVISGESGSGKTETTKFVMTYLAMVGGREGVGELESRILDTNPIMEAFGNAKTLRNDNSSRFGKFIQIRFNEGGHVAGAVIRNYLLEKSRLIFQSTGERNYHIFYQLCKGASTQQKEQWHLGDCEEYHYLNQSDCYVAEKAYGDGETDETSFPTTVTSMRMIGMQDDEVNSVLQLVAALLHLGNLTFTEDGEGSAIDGFVSIAYCAELLGVDSESLGTALIKKSIKVGMENVVTDRSVDDANHTRDALAKASYRFLFDWLISRINTSLVSDTDDKKLFIGLLDIFGFESFKFNSFEQMCINYANEKLQKFFNDHVLVMEQKEYEKEEIDWTQIEWVDNQPCLDLIEKKPAGILPLLDEECMLSSAASDKSFHEKIKQNNDKHAHFKSNKFGKPAFTIKHYAGDVEYDCNGFLDKNNDAFHSDLSNCMKSSSNSFLQDLFKRGLAPAEADGSVAVKKKPGPRGRAGAGKKTAFVSVGGQFRTQLQDLMDTLSTTYPYFVRCIKPTPEKVAGKFDRPSVTSQLKCGGVVEAVRVCQAGFPTRYPYEDLWDAMGYKVMVSLKDRNLSPKEGMKKVMEQVDFEKSAFQFGKTKLFFKVGFLAQLEDARIKAIEKAVVKVQCAARQHVARLLLSKCRASITLQRFARVIDARRRFERQIAAMKAQSVVRRTIYQSLHCHKLTASFVLQNCARRVVARDQYCDMVSCHRASVALASNLLRMQKRAAFANLVSAATVAVSHVHMAIARIEYVRQIVRIASATIISMKFRRHRLANRCYNRLVGKSVAVLQSSSRRAVASKMLTARIASAQLWRICAAYGARNRFAKARPACIVLQAHQRRCVGNRAHCLSLSQMYGREYICAVLRRLPQAISWKDMAEAGLVLNRCGKVALSQKCLLQNRTIIHLQSAIRRCMAQDNHIHTLERRHRAARRVQADVRGRLERDYWADSKQRMMDEEAARAQEIEKEKQRREQQAKIDAIVEEAKAARAYASEIQELRRHQKLEDCHYEYSDIGDAPDPLQSTLRDIAELAVPGLSFPAGLLKPSEPCMRRTFARCIMFLNNFYHKGQDLHVRPAVASTCDELAYEDVKGDDPDFDCIQGLAEAGLLDSRLLNDDADAKFYPNDTLSRESMVVMKALIDARGDLDEATAADIKKCWRFKDAQKMPQLLLNALKFDHALGDRSTVIRTLPRSMIFLKDKPVTNAEGISSLWFIGTGQGRDGPSAADAKPKRKRKIEKLAASPNLGEGEASPHVSVVPSVPTVAEDEEEEADQEVEDFKTEAAPVVEDTVPNDDTPSAVVQDDHEAVPEKSEPAPPSPLSTKSKKSIFRRRPSQTMEDTAPASISTPQASDRGYRTQALPTKESKSSTFGKLTGTFRKLMKSKKKTASDVFADESVASNSGNGVTAHSDASSGGINPIDSMKQPITIFGELLARSQAEDLSDMQGMKVFRDVGQTKEGQRAIWVTAKNVQANKSWILERLFYQFLSIADNVAQQPYVVVIDMTSFRKSKNMPASSWLKKVMEQLPRSYKKNISKIILVEPSAMLQFLQVILSAIGVGDKVRKKLIFAKRENMLRYFEHSQIHSMF